MTFGLLLFGSALFSRAEDPPTESDKVNEIRALLGAKTAKVGLESPTPELIEGIPHGVRIAAERIAALRGMPLKGADAYESVLDQLRSRAAARPGLESFDFGLSTEAIQIALPMLRPALIVCNDRINEPVPKKWHADLNAHRAKLERACASVGLISCTNLPGINELGTGFVVAPRVVMTNRHVAEAFAKRNGELRRHPLTGEKAAVSINFAVDHCANAARVFKIARVLHIEADPGPDVAILQLEDGADGLRPLTFLSERISVSPLVQKVYIPGYPFADPRNPEDAQIKVFGSVFGVKRLAPGFITSPPNSARNSDGLDQFLFHDCSTLGGNSGSPLIDLESGKVVGIHFGGRFQEANWAWASWRLLEIPQVKSVLSEPVSLQLEPARLRRPAVRAASFQPKRAEAADRTPSDQPGTDEDAEAPTILPSLPFHDDEVRELLAPEVDPAADSTSELREGIPHDVAMIAKTYAAQRTGKQVDELEAVKLVLDEQPTVSFVGDTVPVDWESNDRTTEAFLAFRPLTVVSKAHPTRQLSMNVTHAYSVVSGALPPEALPHHVSVDVIERMISRPMLAAHPTLVIAGNERIPPSWKDDLEPAKDRILEAYRAVGKFHTRWMSAHCNGTGFMISNDLLLTNRHVIDGVIENSGDGHWTISKPTHPQGGLFIDFAGFYTPIADADNHLHRIVGVEFVAPAGGPDLAVLKLDSNVGQHHPALKLAVKPPVDAEAELVYAVGYPAQSLHLDFDVVDPLLGSQTTRGIKRLSPGKLCGTEPGIVFHDCSTLAGSSGSPILNLDTNEVVGVHYCAIPHKAFRIRPLEVYTKVCRHRKEDINYAVAAWHESLKQVRALVAKASQ